MGALGQLPWQDSSLCGGFLAEVLNRATLPKLRRSGLRPSMAMPLFSYLPRVKCMIRGFRV